MGEPVMPGNVLKLKFEDKGAGMVAGCAWITFAGKLITPDCATFGELDYQLKLLEKDIAAIRKKGRREFHRLQGGAEGKKD